MATIGVNLLWLVPGVVGGSEEYTVRLLRAFDKAQADDLWLRIYGRSALFETYPDLARRFEYETAPTWGGRPVRVAAENTWLASATRNDDVVHHAGGVVPLVRSRPPVLTIHDLQPIEMPQHFSLIKRRWLGAMLPRSAQAARLILCPSQFTADRIHQLLQVPAGKIEVVAHGHQQVEPGVTDDAVAADLRRRYGRFLLCPSITYPHKRQTDLVAALGHLGDRFGDLSIVLTGRPGPEDDNIRAQAAELGLADRVHLLGRVPVDELDALYRSATAMVFPSEYEGFGNPVLEAMARGCPVVVSDAGALPEVCGDGGLVVPVRQPAALAAAVARVAEEPGLAEQLASAGVERAAHYSWLGAGARLAAAYRCALQPV